MQFSPRSGKAVSVPLCHSLVTAWLKLGAQNLCHEAGTRGQGTPGPKPQRFPKPSSAASRRAHWAPWLSSPEEMKLPRTESQLSWALLPRPAPPSHLGFYIWKAEPRAVAQACCSQFCFLARPAMPSAGDTKRTPGGPVPKGFDLSPRGSEDKQTENPQRWGQGWHEMARGPGQTLARRRAVLAPGTVPAPSSPEQMCLSD